MLKPRVLIHSHEPEIALDILKQAHPDLSPAICAQDHRLAECVERYRPDVVFSVRHAGSPFPRSSLVESPSVKWVSNAGSGVNHLMPWDPEKVTVTNSAGVAADMMAEYALGIMLHFALDVPGMMRDKNKRVWRERFVSPLHNKCLVILGLGKTGRALAKKAKALDMNVLGVRANPRETEHVDMVLPSNELHQALVRADYLVVCLPLLESTAGLLGEEEFNRLRPGAVLVDVSRGGIVQEPALLNALSEGRLAGAGLDVFANEPLPPDSPLWTLDNVFISPHCSSVYQGWENVSVQLFSDNLVRWRNAQTLENIVDPSRGY